MSFDRKQFKYCPFYCEENIWHLCQEDFFLPFHRKVLFISNQKQCVPILEQKAGSPVYWDYHVVLLYKDIHWKIADLDTLLAFPCHIEEYLYKSFMQSDPPSFRVVDVQDFIKFFASDRRHMIDHRGNYLQSPPPWDKIGTTGFTLGEFIDFTQTDHGQLYDLGTMYTTFT